MEGYDFLIIGSGIPGITIGMELTKKGFKTLNIDRSMDLGYPDLSEVLLWSPYILPLWKPYPYLWQP